MFEYEDALITKGYKYIVGIDEVGMGCLAGPVMAAAVVLDLQKARFLSAPLQLKTKVKAVRINDSKKLKPAERAVLVPAIKKIAVAYNIGVVAPYEINSHRNIRQMGYLARYRAVQPLIRLNRADYILCDFFDVPEVYLPQQGITKGDTKSISIAAASILAKVARDTYMADLDNQFPGYEWNKNFGYYSDAHIDSIKKLGVTPHHRTYYKPIQEIIESSV